MQRVRVIHVIILETGIIMIASVKAEFNPNYGLEAQLYIVGVVVAVLGLKHTGHT